MDETEEVDSRPAEERQPLSAVTHARVKFVDDNDIMWVPIGDVREFTRVPPSNAEAFDGGKIYRVAWTDKNNVTHLYGATIAELACGEQDRLERNRKRPHFQTVKQCTLADYFNNKELSGSSSDQHVGSSGEEAMDTSDGDAAGDDSADDGMEELNALVNAHVAGPAAGKLTATGKTRGGRERKLVKRVSKSHSNAMVSKRMSKEAYVMGARAQAGLEQSPQLVAPTSGAPQQSANLNAAVVAQSSSAIVHQNALGAAGNQQQPPPAFQPPPVLENDDPPSRRPWPGDGVDAEEDRLAHENGLPAPGVNDYIEEARRENGPRLQNVPALNAAGLVGFAAQQNLQPAGRLAPHPPVPAQVVQQNRNIADGGAPNGGVIGRVDGEHRDQPIQGIGGLLAPRPVELVQGARQGQDDVEDAEMDEGIQPYRVQIPVAGFIDPPAGLQKYDTLDDGRQTYLGHNRVVPTTFWAFHRNRPKWIFVADSAVMLCGEHVLVNSAVDLGRTTVNLPGRSPRRPLPTSVHRYLKELLADYIDARQPLWEHKHALMMKMNKCLGEKIKSVRRSLFPGLVRADSTRADRNRRA